MGHLEQIDVGQVVLQQRGIDVLFDVAHQQDTTVADLTEQDDRDVVDARPTVGRGRGHLAADRPQDPQADLVDIEVIARRECHADRRARPRQVAEPRGVAGSRAAHPRFEDAAHLVPLQQQREAGDVVLVRMTEDHGIDAAIPRRDPGIEHDQEAIRVGATIDQQPAAPGSLDEDGVALSDIEDGDPGDPGRPGDHD
jgi:hypothetical protein